jgi:acid phosphatase (class A)
LPTNGFYPSGHSSIGWAWAEVLAEIAPGRLDKILERGRAFGESRIICSVHWATDVIGGRTIAAPTVVRLHADPEFLADVHAAKKELEALGAKGLPPQRDCKFEDHALKQTRRSTPRNRRRVRQDGVKRNAPEQTRSGAEVAAPKGAKRLPNSRDDYS